MATFIKNMGVGKCCDCSGRTTACASCGGGCPFPTLMVDSVSASHTKCGYDEFGTPSSPPKIYSTKSQSGGLTNVDYLGNGYVYSNYWSGGVTLNRFTCSPSSDTRNLYATVTGNCTNSANFAGTQAQVDYDPGSFVYNGLYVWGIDCSSASLTQLFGCSGPTVDSTVQMIYAQSSCSGGSGSDVILALSDEYTTGQLKVDTVSLLPSWPGTFSSGYTSSYLNVSSDELTCSIRRIRYKFQLPSLAGITCYKIYWYEGTVPKSYIWNGTDTQTPIYYLDEPNSNGTTSINNLTVSCVC